MKHIHPPVYCPLCHQEVKNKNVYRRSGHYCKQCDVYFNGQNDRILIGGKEVEVK